MSGNRISRRQMIATCAAASLSSGAVAASSPPHVTAVAFSPDGKQIVAGSQAGVSIRNVDEGTVADRIATELENIHDICFSPDGQLLAVAGGIPGESGVIEIVDWPGGELRQRIEPHGDVVYQVDFAADGSRLVSASADEVCAMNVIGKDRPAARFTQHSRAVLAVTMLPDGETAVSASRDETLASLEHEDRRESADAPQSLARSACASTPAGEWRFASGRFGFRRRHRSLLATDDRTYGSVCAATE